MTLIESTNTYTDIIAAYIVKSGGGIVLLTVKGKVIVTMEPGIGVRVASGSSALIEGSSVLLVWENGAIELDSSGEMLSRAPINRPDNFWFHYFKRFGQPWQI